MISITTVFLKMFFNFLTLGVVCNYTEIISSTPHILSMSTTRCSLQLHLYILSISIKDSISA